MAGYSPWGHKELDRPEQLALSPFHCSINIIQYVSIRMDIWAVSMFLIRNFLFIKKEDKGAHM